jgi:hypothetical protein
VVECLAQTRADHHFLQTPQFTRFPSYIEHKMSREGRQFPYALPPIYRFPISCHSCNNPAHYPRTPGFRLLGMPEPFPIVRLKGTGRRPSDAARAIGDLPTSALLVPGLMGRVIARGYGSKDFSQEGEG